MLTASKPKVGGQYSPTRRAVLAAGASAAALALLPPRAFAAVKPAAILNDASRLNPTPVAVHLGIGRGDEARMIADLRHALKDARETGRSVSMGCARHSMGGQSLGLQSTAISFQSELCEADTANGRYLARAGTRWQTVVGQLDRIGFSPKVMQSNSDFGVGGTLSVNAHGWPAPFGPFGSTVRRFRLLLADGSLVQCSRQENAELFRLVTGGYGLFGAIVDAEIEMVPNRLLVPQFEVLAADQFGPRMAAHAGDPQLQMMYGRLSVDRKHFLEEAILVSFRPDANAPQALPVAKRGSALTAASREIFRAQVGSEIIKKTRWFAESKLGPRIAPGRVTRNSLLYGPVSELASRNRTRTDILHEYFLPPEKLGAFLLACRGIILSSRQELLNVTLRYLAADMESVLAYAPQPRVAAVMLFSQPITAEHDADMRVMTQGLIEHVLDMGGSFYLPYRLHARKEHVLRAYPNALDFIAAKRKYDPALLFRNMMWEQYFA